LAFEALKVPLEDGTIYDASWILIVGLGLIVLMIVLKIYQATREANEYNSENYQPNTIYPLLLPTTFKKNKYSNYCGIEIECLQKGKSIKSEEVKLFHFDKGGDGSLSSDGVEFKSYPANGDRLIEIIERFCKKLNNNGYKIDTSCGLHLHIETKPDLDLLKKLYCFYSKYEPYFFAMLPKSRQNNGYCQKFNKTDKYKWEELIDITTLGDFKKMFYENFWFFNRVKHQEEHGYHKRYCWMNFHSIFYRGTLEIRAHSGTISYEKIKNWIMIHLIIRDYLENHTLKEVMKRGMCKGSFLKIFPSYLQGYIKERWKAFPDTAEANFKEYSVISENDDGDDDE
jgi:hypothetical protein